MRVYSCYPICVDVEDVTVDWILIFLTAALTEYADPLTRQFAGLPKPLFWLAELAWQLLGAHFFAQHHNCWTWALC